MKTLYLDKEFKCHVSRQSESDVEIETEYFDEFDDYYIESHVYIPAGYTYNGKTGKVAYPWRPVSEEAVMMATELEPDPASEAPSQILTIARFRVDGADNQLIVKYPFASGEVGSNITVKFDEHWRNLTAYARFIAGKNEYNAKIGVIEDVGVGYTVAVPAVVLIKPYEKLMIGFCGRVGSSSSNIITTEYYDLDYIPKGAICDKETPDSGGKPIQSKTVKATKNNELVEVTPDSGYVLDNVKVDVQIPEQSKTVATVSNGQLVVKPDDGNLMNEVIVDVDVPSDAKMEQIKRKTVEVNKTTVSVTPDPGKTIREAIVTVNIPEETKEVSAKANGYVTIEATPGSLMKKARVNVQVPSDAKTEQEKIASIRQNGGEVVVTPDRGKALSKVTVTADIPAVDREVRVVENGRTLVKPDEGQFLNSVAVEVDIPSDKKPETKDSKKYTVNNTAETITPPKGSVFTSVDVEVAIPEDTITKDVTTNGNYEILPKPGHLIKSASVNVKIPSNQKPEQEKTVEVSSNGPVVITPDEGQTLNKATVNVNVPSDAKQEQAKTIRVTEHKTYTVVPDEGMALSSVNINVATPKPKPEEKKEVTISQNGVTSVAPTDGSVLNQVDVTVAVPSDKKPEQEKTVEILENGTTEVLPDPGSVLSKVVVNTNTPPGGDYDIKEFHTRGMLDDPSVAAFAYLDIPFLKGSGEAPELQIWGDIYVGYSDKYGNHKDENICFCGNVIRTTHFTSSQGAGTMIIEKAIGRISKIKFKNHDGVMCTVDIQSSTSGYFIITQKRT